MASFGNPNGHAAVPAAGRAVDVSRPTTVVGDGSVGSCTSAAVVAAVAKGGVITFSCGSAPVVITMAATAKVVNSAARVVIDGGGKVTLSGGGQRRILYMNTCDKAQTWTTSHCQNQSQPQLTLQNITFADGNSTGQQAFGGGGGAVFASGGRLAIVNARFVGNRCDSTGPDLGGAAVRALQQWQNQPVYVVGSTFGGSPGLGGVCSNGGALSSIGVSWDVINCVMSYNKAIGNGANPASAGTPGGGSGGAIYTDGDAYTVTLAGTRIEHNDANEGGGAVFYVSNNRTGTLTIRDSALTANVSAKFSTAGYPGIFFLGAGHPVVSGSTLK
ncbi:Polymorphic membrane protein Chlamydia [Catenulispora acidiphila DSM 44928]|uniref:Polymorphic membrane protein Chlamydia n=2 Tax=Catenulispora TaxID=414878 RepID=C7QAC1_CATAD|nr:Polymorphic membrane protein Chlamydia [Catenulispora acidiphila DSM 44928]